MRNNWLNLAGLLAFWPAGHATEASQRFHPANAGYVVLQLPAAESDRDAPRLRSQLQLATRDAEVAQRVAGQYLEQARATREQRYFGRAEAVLQPWLVKSNPPAALLVLQADILQNRHDFPGALRLLDRAVAQDSRSTRARLLRATVLMVRGEPMRARSDCAALMGMGETSLGSICLAQTLASMGQLGRAAATIELIVARHELSDAPSLAWAQSSLADIASRRGDRAAAERYWRAALAYSTHDEFIRCALSDILIARGATDEALMLLDLPHPSVGILVRRALAQSVAADITARRATLTQLNELLRLEAQRSERVHLREETLLAMGEARPVAQVLQLARSNFAVQREAVDVRLLARAASVAQDRTTLAQLEAWCTQTGFRDRLVNELLGRSPP